MSSCVRGGLAESPGVGVQGTVDDVGQVALEDAEAGFAGLVLVLPRRWSREAAPG
jgi:hypothetical protein